MNSDEKASSGTKESPGESDNHYFWLMEFYITAAIIYLVLTVFTSLKIAKSRMLSRQQKTINMVLNALIPVLWLYLTYPIIFPKDTVMTKAQREKMIAEESGSKLGDEIGSSRDARYL